jgi:hypothetical protein
MLSGPFLYVAEGGGPAPELLERIILLSWITLPALFAHPIRPNLFTGFLTAVGAVFWFSAGMVTMIDFVWGA